VEDPDQNGMSIAPASVAPMYAYVLGKDGQSSTPWGQFWTTAITSLPGVVIALLVVVVTDYFSKRRERVAAERTFELAKQRNAFERAESIRKEMTQRKLDALEKAAASIPASMNELRILRVQADEGKFPGQILGALSQGCASLQIHFRREFVEPIEKLELEFGECIKSIGAVALAKSWLIMRSDGIATASGVEGERRNERDALNAYSVALRALESSAAVFLEELKAAAVPLTSS
jgi:hypothetical protein